MAFCASVAAAVCFARGTEIAQPLLLTTKTAGTFQTPAIFKRFGHVALRGRTVAEDADRGPFFAAQPEGQRHADRMRRMGPDRNAIGKVFARTREIVAAFIAAPVQEQFLQA